MQGYMVPIVEYDNMLNEALNSLECPQCKIKYSADYWRNLLRYPRGKVMERNFRRIVCDNCNFTYELTITLDLSNFKKEINIMKREYPPKETAQTANIRENHVIIERPMFGNPLPS